MEYENFYENIGCHVKRFRKEQGFSQEKLAELIGKSNDTISNIERGVYPPRMDTVLDLAQVLGIPPYKLFIFGDLPRGHEQYLEMLLEIIGSLQDKPVAFLYIVKQQIQWMTDLYEMLPEEENG